MRLTRIRDTAELVAGTVILSAGLGLSALSASERSFTGVFLGFLLFILGYKLSQISVRSGRRPAFRGTVRDILAQAWAVDILMVIVGAGTITYGFVMLFGSIETANILRALAAALLMFLGYAMAHYGVNKTVV